MFKITRGIAIQNREIKERFVRAMGPDGRNPRREATAVELRLDLTASSLPPAIKQRLIMFGGKHVTRDGVLVVVSREYRSQARNRKAARHMLAALIRTAAAAPVEQTNANRPQATRERGRRLRQAENTR